MTKNHKTRYINALNKNILNVFNVSRKKSGQCLNNVRYKSGGRIHDKKAWRHNVDEKKGERNVCWLDIKGQ